MSRPAVEWADQLQMIAYDMREPEHHDGSAGIHPEVLHDFARTLNRIAKLLHPDEPDT
jgi:hypothetical protein